VFRDHGRLQGHLLGVHPRSDASRSCFALLRRGRPVLYVVAKPRTRRIVGLAPTRAHVTKAGNGLAHSVRPSVADMSLSDRNLSALTDGDGASRRMVR
jgi:hypothetical protein